jgi:hypothetical protein
MRHIGEIIQPMARRVFDAERFPFLSHRSIAEVAETETLRQRRSAGSLKDTGRWRLAALEARAWEPDRINNDGDVA